MSKPYYDTDSDTWRVELPDRVEEGCLEYVITEYLSSGLFYKFSDGDHAHTFDGVMEKILDNPETFSIDGYEEQYSAQELELIHLLVDKLKEDLCSKNAESRVHGLLYPERMLIMTDCSMVHITEALLPR